VKSSPFVEVTICDLKISIHRKNLGVTRSLDISAEEREFFLALLHRHLPGVIV
jgi:hypothetical protein